MTYNDISWLFSWKDYWYAGISAIIGALLGIAWANSQTVRKNRLQLAKSRRLLLESVEFNLQRLAQMIDMLQNQSILPNFLLDSDTLSKRLDSISDFFPDQVVSRLSWERYQLEHINSKLTFINATSPITGTGTIVDPTRLTDLLKHVRKTHEALNTLKEDFEAFPAQKI